MRRMTAATVTLAIACLGALACLGLFALAGYTYTLDGDGLRGHNPQAEAQATRTAQLARDEAARRAIERQKLMAEAEAAAAAKPAVTARNALIAFGIGAFVLVLGVGSAFACAAWLNKRATSIYADEKGLFPLVVRRGFGWCVIHDPNRGLGPGAVYRTPTALDVIAGAVRYLRTGRAPGLPELTAGFPATASERTMAQVAGQAQSVQLMAAATRPAGLLGGQAATDAKEARQLAGEVAKNRDIATAARMPQLRVIDDPQRIADFESLLPTEET